MLRSTTLTYNFTNFDRQTNKSREQVYMLFDMKYGTDLILSINQDQQKFQKVFEDETNINFLKPLLYISLPTKYAAETQSYRVLQIRHAL